MMKILLMTAFLFSLFAFAQDKAPVAKKRHVYVDKGGDKVTVLDLDKRVKMKQDKPVEASTIYDDAQTAPEKVKPKQIYGSYTTKEGESLKTISQKIYGNDSHWKELYILNRDLLKAQGMKPGMILKYVPVPKNGQKSIK